LFGAALGLVVRGWPIRAGIPASASSSGATGYSYDFSQAKNSFYLPGV